MADAPHRHVWDNEIEFLMSCIATTVGLGNVWRFPFVAYMNGGGAFLIPYIIVLIVVGKPMYYLECGLGQFSSKNSVNVWALSPALRGTGYVQALVVIYVVSYYLVIVALCMFYLVHSFDPQLPWSKCDPAWDNCVSSDPNLHEFEAGNIPRNASSSSELYFLNRVLQFQKDIDKGIGNPIWYLSVSLLASWLIVFFVMIRGIKSSGKASYFLAIFPYTVMLILFITTCTLPGSAKGILFFLTPQWKKLMELKVWYAAITQMFFSLSVCQGPLIMFSSYNSFSQNIYRDSLIITTLDTLTSLLSGFTIFGILGNLALELHQEIWEVIGAGGASLAFISYPDAICKTVQPQLFSVLFFLMMTVLGVGTAVSFTSSINAVFLDAFPHTATSIISATCCCVGFCLGLVYVTPGGQYILELVDHYGGTFVALVGAISEIIGVMWIYGVENIAEDFEFMTKRKPSAYWRVCWVVLIPVMLITVFIYAFSSYEAVKYGNYNYPIEAHIAGYCLLALGFTCVPLFMIIGIFKSRGGGCVAAAYGASTGNEGEYVNNAFEFDGKTKSSPEKQDIEKSGDAAKKANILKEDRSKERPKWDNQIEFLMSCIATSVGLGNVWRFPFVAYQNGGGAFLIPYIIVLLVIGKPMYFLETVLGQFSSSNCVKIWALSPAMKGTGYAQALGASYVLSYYVSIIALCLYYLAMSFNATLPWALCNPEWEQFENCVPSGEPAPPGMQRNLTSSAELYFTQTVLRQSNGIHDGIGAPLWDLSLCLLASWIIIFVIVARGVKSSGKASYFLAIFPYIIMIILLIRAVTLPGAGKGILFFLTPEWSKILEIRVWYAAVTQVFFSLSVCSGALIMFASYNNFSQNVYRDSMIVTTLDTFTSLMSGITIFGVLGNLAEQLNYDDVGQVIGSGGTSLAFISYPDAIAQSPVVPQLFAVLFFLMMAVLGVGSGVALLSTVNTILLDAFPRVPTVVMSAIACTAGFAIGLIYVTPGGQFLLELVDYYGGTFMRLFAAITETIGVFWIYGLENICLDIEYMLKMKTSIYWRVCWAIVTPVIMIAVFMYAIVTTEALVFGGDGGYVYPNGAYIAGYCLQYTGMALIPIFIFITMWKYRTGNFVETVKVSFRKKPTYGPREEDKREEWRQFRQDAKYSQNLKRNNWFHHIGLSLFGGYRRNN